MNAQVTTDDNLILKPHKVFEPSEGILACQNLSEKTLEGKYQNNHGVRPCVTCLKSQDSGGRK